MNIFDQTKMAWTAIQVYGAQSCVQAKLEIGIQNFEGRVVIICLLLVIQKWFDDILESSQKSKNWQSVLFYMLG